MAVVTTINGDLRVQGDLTVTGSKPTVQRSELVQDNNFVYPVPVTDMRVWDNLNALLPATAVADDLEITEGVLGTDSPTIQTGDLKAAGATTRYCRCQVVLPAEYQAGQTVQLRLSAGMKTTVADTSATVDVEAHRIERDGTVGADLVTTAATTINSLTLADKDFAITATSLLPGDVLDVRIAMAVNDGATGTAVIGMIGAVELLCDVKG